MEHNSQVFSGTTGPLTVFRRPAMASDFEISFNEDRSDFGAPFALDALDEVDRIENILTVFKTSSLVSRLNALASEMPYRVPEEFFNWLVECKHLSEETEGAFDITCSPLWKVWGFARREGAVPSAGNLDAARKNVGWRHLILDPEERTVKFDQPGVEISFGSIGKGLALDQASVILDRADLTDYLFQGGQSSALAKGGRKGDFRNGKDSLEKCWTIGVTHPLRPERRLAELRLSGQALGTSGSQYQFFRYRGKRYAHIIDPRTGEPVSGILSAIAIAPTARLADALSTAFFIFGPDKTEKWCQNHPEISALLLVETNAEPSLELIAFNMPQDNFHLL